MLGPSEELLADIDATLDQLNQNAQALKSASMNSLFTHEVEALKKTQESLLARLMDRQALLKTDQKRKTLESIRKKTLQKKIVEYSKKQLSSFKRRRKQPLKRRSLN